MQRQIKLTLVRNTGIYTMDVLYEYYYEFFYEYYYEFYEVNSDLRELIWDAERR